MTEAQRITHIDRLRTRTAEAEWYEFKENRVPHNDELGHYLAGLSNAAALAHKRYGYLIVGINDDRHEVVGTAYDPYAATAKGQDLLHWLSRGFDPRVHVSAEAVAHPDGRVVVFEVGAARDRPVSFYGKAKIRVGSSLTNLSEHPELERALWNLQTDWSAAIAQRATLDHLDPNAIAKAREEFTEKNRRQAEQIERWDDLTFLNKAHVTLNGDITHTALLLLGKPEAAPLLAPAVAKVSWILKDNTNTELDYEHFGPPLILQVDQLLSRIRNLKLRTLPSGTLFPDEVHQYEPWVLREALHNAIAHQDYGLRGRITLVETPDSLRISNVGSFLPGTVEQVIQQDAPQEIYRNPFLANAMVNLNMIDTQGGGIKRMYRTQRERFFPMPDYDLSDPERVVVTIPGKILNQQYTKLLMKRTDIDLWQVLMLDKVQKGETIPHETHKALRKEGLVEGRYPNTILSGKVAQATGQEAQHIRQRGLDNQYYRDLVVEFIRAHGPVSRSDIDALLLDKLPESLDPKQKKNKVHNVLSSLSRKDIIENQGSRTKPAWMLGPNADS